MAIKRFIFIRCGETDWNLKGRWQGWVASPLNDLGRQQIQRLSNFIRHIGLNQLYCSDHRRAQESAEILAERLDFDPIYDERLRERSIGFFQGLTVPEIHGWYPEEYKGLLADPEGYRMPLGESTNDVKVRAQSFLDEVLKTVDKKDDELTIGVLSHTTTIRLMIRHLIPEVDLANISFSNSSVTTVAREKGDWRLVTVNDLMHLEGLESRFMPYDIRGDDRQ
jgi:broad specificity phosphatase PhoE